MLLTCWICFVLISATILEILRNECRHSWKWKLHCSIVSNRKILARHACTLSGIAPKWLQITKKPKQWVSLKLPYKELTMSTVNHPLPGRSRKPNSEWVVGFFWQILYVGKILHKKWSYHVQVEVRATKRHLLGSWSLSYQKMDWWAGLHQSLLLWHHDKDRDIKRHVLQHMT